MKKDDVEKAIKKIGKGKSSNDSMLNLIASEIGSRKSLHMTSVDLFWYIFKCRNIRPVVQKKNLDEEEKKHKSLQIASSKIKNEFDIISLFKMM